MSLVAGLDVSQSATTVCIVDDDGATTFMLSGPKIRRRPRSGIHDVAGGGRA
jgi:hypothetical protein